MGTDLRVEESKGRAGANQDSKQSLDSVLVLPEPAALTDSTATSASFKEFTRETAYSGELQWSLSFQELTSCLICEPTTPSARFCASRHTCDNRVL